MSDPLLSSSWYRVADLKPRPSPHTQLYRHHYRGQRWYVLQNRSTRRCQLLTPAAHLLVGLMDGKRTTHQVWEEAARQLGDDCPTQDETIRLLGMLYFAESLACDVSPDTAEMFRRTERRESSEQWRKVLHPLYKTYVRRSTRFTAHDADNTAHMGDEVEIVQTRPLSKTKRWRLVRVLREAPRGDVVTGVEDAEIPAETDGAEG